MNIYILWVVGLYILSINYTLHYFVYNKEKCIKYILYANNIQISEYYIGALLFDYIIALLYILFTIMTFLLQMEK